MKSLQQWWQRQTGEEETPFDGDSFAFLGSLFFHMCLLIALGLIPLVGRHIQVTLDVTTPLEEEEVEELELPEEFYFSEQPAEQVGANSVSGVQMAMSLAPNLSEVSDVPSPVDFEPTVDAKIEINQEITVATGLHYSENMVVKGAAGQGTTGAMGAIDRITHEILLSLEERETLVIWLFDQSGSLARQRAAIHDRFDRIYEELGVIEAAGNEAFAKHKDKPLLTSVVGFGQQVNLMINKPTDNLAEIKDAVAAIKQDDSGEEKVFSALHMAADHYKSYRVPQGESGEPDRNVMLIVFTDEIGDDQNGLEPTIQICRRYEMPVYVVGVPAPFGRRETLVKWVDPDPQYDQTPQWGRVNQGPESFMPERINLTFGASREDKDPIDSGFGPFALTRLCYETGGIYFTVHPNRNVNREVSRNETAEFSAHIKHFFDPHIMRAYRPDYVTPDEYLRRVSSIKSRAALLKAAQMSWLKPLDQPETRFVKRSEAELANDLTKAQQAAARLEPEVEMLYQTLKLGEADRAKEVSPRWQAGYDLAMGRVMAVKVRTEAYNAMLAKAKRGMNFKNDKNNTWILRPTNDLTELGSVLAKSGTKANEYLTRVIEEHAGTPWALLAQRELETPLGFEWVEEYTDLTPRNTGAGGGNNNNPAPANDTRKMIKKGPPKRPLPKL